MEGWRRMLGMGKGNGWDAMEFKVNGEEVCEWTGWVTAGIYMGLVA